jgi:sugar phosphate isomerase/epimerase
MRLGIFARTFVRSILEATLDAVKAHGLDCVQFNMACAGLPTLPERIEAEVCERIRRELAVREIEMAAVSGTFNMIHPDARQRREGLRRLGILAEACPALGAPVITLCTGTRDPENMWRPHPDNDSPQAWHDVVDSLKAALRLTDGSNITLAIEPEISNVVDSAPKARRLLDEIGSPRLKIVIDGANLFHAGELARMREILDEAFALLGPDIILAHAKDLNQDGEAGHAAAGQGKLDYPYYLRQLRSTGFSGPLILHGLTENQVDGCVRFLRETMHQIEEG